MISILRKWITQAEIRKRTDYDGVILVFDDHHSSKNLCPLLILLHF